jgi:hypothetical protein
MKRNERESHKLLMVFRFINNSDASSSAERNHSSSFFQQVLLVLSYTEKVGSPALNSAAALVDCLGSSFFLLLLSALCAVCWRKSSSRWRVYDIRLRRLTNETRGREKKIAGEKERERKSSVVVHPYIHIYTHTALFSLTLVESSPLFFLFFFFFRGRIYISSLTLSLSLPPSLMS